MTDDITYQLKNNDERISKLSKILFGNGEKGLIEIVKVLAERMESRKETHDKDVMRIEKTFDVLSNHLEKLSGKFERMLWWMLTQSVILLIGIVVVVFELMVKR